MRAWPTTPVPSLPLRAPTLRLHDTATDAVVDVAPGPAEARMYVCGITPYDATHLGHAATYVTFDLINRAWRNAGQSVRYVQNVTDIDDPLLERAAATGEDWMELAERETDLFRRDMTALRVLAPDVFVGAVESIPLVADMVEELRGRGAVYRVEDDLYFPIACDPDFGSVSGWNREQMREIFPARGGDPERAGKQDPLDALLWRAERPDEPAWETALGRGRPGWHIECSAIARHYLGPEIDIQGGGSDLVFPHHEMSASHARVAADGTPFARTFVHSGMVGLDGEKMSKSQGNLELVSRLRDNGVDPMAIRLAILAHRYRIDWEWSEEVLAAAERRLALWRRAVARTRAPLAEPVTQGVLAALADDLDAPTALSIIDAWADSEASGDPAEERAGAAVRDLVDAALGVAL